MADVRFDIDYVASRAKTLEEAAIHVGLLNSNLGLVKNE
jgi:hypothetical protein